MKEKNYKVVFETYKYEYEFESEDFDDEVIVKGSYSTEKEAWARAKEMYEDVLNEFMDDLGEDFEEYVQVDEENGYCIWDYTSVDDEGDVKKWLFYVEAE